MRRTPVRRPILALVLAWAPALASAEVRVELGAWHYDVAGTVTDKGKTYDFDRDLNLQPSGRGNLVVAWDTSPGWWPDWSASYTKFGARGHHVEVTTIGTPPLQITRTDTIDATANLRDYDVAATWPMHAGALALSAGLAVERLAGDVTIDDTSNPPPSHETYGQTFPELRLGARMPLGGSFALDGAAQGVSYGGNRAVEWRAGAELRLFQRLLLSAGYQVKRYKVDLSSYKLDARLSGALVSVGWVFP
jgi:hypothetical protein